MRRNFFGLFAMLVFGTLSAAGAGDGTLGYNGNMPVNLSMINSMFQINVDDVNQIVGDFLVVDDVGTMVTSFSLTMIDPFSLTTPRQNDYASFFNTFALTSADCPSGCATADMVTYNWPSGTTVPIGVTFDLNFASRAGDGTHQGGAAAVAPIPEAISIVLLGTVLLLTSGALRKKMARRP